MQTCKQSGVGQILKVCKERERVWAVNTRSQNFATNNSAESLIILKFHIIKYGLSFMHFMC